MPPVGREIPWLCQIWAWSRLSHRFNSFSLTIHPVPWICPPWSRRRLNKPTGESLVRTLRSRHEIQTCKEFCVSSSDKDFRISTYIISLLMRTMWKCSNHSCLEGIKVLLGAHHKWIIEKTSKKNEDVGIFFAAYGGVSFFTCSYIQYARPAGALCGYGILIWCRMRMSPVPLHNSTHLLRYGHLKLTH